MLCTGTENKTVQGDILWRASVAQITEDKLKRFSYLFISQFRETTTNRKNARQPSQVIRLKIHLTNLKQTFSSY